MVGYVVQRHGDELVVLGKGSGKCFPRIFSAESSCYVRILEEGTVIELSR